LIDSKGIQLGIFFLSQALERAKSDNLDLVEIFPNSNPPVCKIMNYGKYQFQQIKKKAAENKKQKNLKTTKEIKIRPSTELGDYKIKIKHMIRFLKSGNKLKITLRYKGREIMYQELGINMIERIKEDLKEYAFIECQPKLEGRQITMTLNPLKK